MNPYNPRRSLPREGIKRVLVTGDRNWDDRQTIYDCLYGFDADTVIVHGGAKGADSLAGEVAEELGLKVEVYPANWKKYGRAAGPIRNQDMVDTLPDLVLAFHPDLEKSKGTKDCVNRANNRGLEVRIIDGK